MHLEKLSLINFRNYSKLNLDIPSGLSIIMGENAQGKSSVVEAIYLLATSKSYRTSKDTDMIKINENFCRISAKVIKEKSADVEPSIVISKKDKKKISINGVTYQKLGDAIGKINAVIFSSNDLDMISGEPALRRRFLNLEIGQISPRYVQNLSRYKRTLKQRNILIKSLYKAYSKKNVLDEWNIMLASYGAVISKSRAVFVAKLSEKARKIYFELSGKSEELTISYRSGYLNTDFLQMTEEDIKNIFLSETDQTIMEDISRGVTTRGAHRDDIRISINAMNVKSYASQGQLRTAAIAVKIAEMELLEEYSGEKPIVLLDDIMAELDAGRRKNIIEMAQDWEQTIITSASKEDFDIISARAVFNANNGNVERI